MSSRAHAFRRLTAGCYEVVAWAARKELAYAPRSDEYTLAQSVTRAP